MGSTPTTGTMSSVALALCMDNDVAIIKGDIDKPAVIFNHGLGMDRRVWESPDEAKVLGGRFPIRLLLCREPELRGESRGFFFGRPPDKLTTLFHDLKEQGYTVIAWSQRRSAAETEVAVSELRGIIEGVRAHSKAGIILVGHSRGGLVARKYLHRFRDKKVRGLITLSTPHRGSRMAQWAGYIAPLISAPRGLFRLFGNVEKGGVFSEPEKGTLIFAAKRVFEFLASKAVAELLPDSPLFKSLDDGPLGKVYYMSIGGTDPTLFSLYRAVLAGGQKEPEVRLKRVFAFPEALEGLIPERLFPDEMRKGKGDGLVSAESSRLPWADEHYDFELNHAWVLFDEGVRRKVVDALKRLVG